MTVLDSFFLRPWPFCRYRRDKQTWRSIALELPPQKSDTETVEEKKVESAVAMNGLILDGTNPLDQALRALDDSIAVKIKELQRERDRIKNLFTAFANVSEIDRKASERYDLTFILSTQVYQNEPPIDHLRFEVGRASSYMDWYSTPCERRPRLESGRYAVVVGLKRIGDLDP